MGGQDINDKDAAQEWQSRKSSYPNLDERSWSHLKAELKPADGKGEKDGYGIDGPWRAFRVRGPMQFHLVGVLLEFSRCLAQRSISIFTVSTWDTDYICVKESDFGNACKALTEDGWNVVDQGE
ncbi:hypothetical protein [Sporisorium scitamineum]|uniref:CASTOR ACT domain-containing protein n=1 Tax=Sporisorium scitamineum TaxID=49012 RepID=A0A0F7S9W2_9BASI|nr:hypothetical protein [Sporisorium scitamineum]